MTQDMHQGIHPNLQGMAQMLSALQELYHGKDLSAEEPHIGTLFADLPQTAL